MALPFFVGDSTIKAMQSSLEQTSVQYIKGVGPAKKKLFENLGVFTLEDLLYLFPRRYEDRRVMTPIAQTKVGENQTICGKILKQSSRKSWHTKKHVSEITIDDGTGRMSCTWFNQPYLTSYLKPGQKMVCYGKVDVYKNRLQMVSPEFELLDKDESEKNSLSMNRIVPIYPLTRGITQRYLRKLIRGCLDNYKKDLKDELPVALRNKHRLANIKRSIENSHFPEDPKIQEEAMRRISFEEFYFFQISIILRRFSTIQKQGVPHKITDASVLKFIDSFPFELTKAQKKVIREIKADMKKEHPMLRLLQGDVASGKTIVALGGCFMAFHHKCQSAFMAPTEILARQHFHTIKKWIKEGPLKGMKVALLVSGLKKKERDDILLKVASGDIDLVVGTHAIVNEEVTFKSLSFVVIDEQHKFGVRQRALLGEKGTNPDVLIMTATPIPRTLCITLYGDLDLSIINELPKGRGKIKTIEYSEERALEVYTKVQENVSEGRQAYIVYPIIEESEKLDLKAAQEMFKAFQKNEFKKFRLALIHGQMKRSETQEIMERFKKGEIDILVATTVLEVGVDVPNANVMVVEHAERFGLAQLHQLRGRIGRGKHDSFCLLIANSQTDEGAARMQAICSTTDGFKIAQHDLEIRGPGRFFGRHQHGLNELKVANPATQLDILELARKEAIALTRSDPSLEKSNNQDVRLLIVKRYPTYLNFVNAG